MLSVTVTRYQESFVIPTAAPAHALREHARRVVTEAQIALGPRAVPLFVYQQDSPPDLGVTTVTVVFRHAKDGEIAPRTAEDLIVERVRLAPAQPPPLPRSAQAARAGGAGADDWIRLASGGRLYPLRPDPLAITLYDIASGLSRECRYGGQLERLELYTVAEHCVHLSRAVPRHLARWALLHDASEGLGLKDIARPIKGALGPAYGVAEDALMQAVAVRFGLPWPVSEGLKEYDTRILQNERAAIWAEPQAWVTDAAGPPLPDVTIRGWLPYEARAQFLRRADELGIREVSL